MTARPTAHETWMEVAHVVAKRATCDRAHVGCVVVKDGHLIATGYNGSEPGEAHCDDVGHLMHGDNCIRTIHAEHNAILNRHAELKGATVYCTHSPCTRCATRLVDHQVAEVRVGKTYRGQTDGVALLTAAGIEVHVKVEPEVPPAARLEEGPTGAEFQMLPNGDCSLWVEGKNHTMYAGEAEARLAVARLLNEPLERVVAYYAYNSRPLRGEFVLEDVED